MPSGCKPQLYSSPIFVISFPLSSHPFCLTTFVRPSTPGARQLGANRKIFHLHSFLFYSPLLLSLSGLQPTAIVRVRAWVPVGATLGAERTWERSNSTGAPIGYKLQLYSFSLSSESPRRLFSPYSHSFNAALPDLAV